jgi:hypothetical protein
MRQSDIAVGAAGGGAEENKQQFIFTTISFGKLR